MSTEKSANLEPATASQTRRTFLQHIAFGSLTVSAAAIATAATLTATTPADAAQEAKEHRRSVKVFRLRSRKTVACHACQLHHRHLIFLTRKVAKHNRAHPRCDCPISTQWIKQRTFNRLFKSSSAKENGFVDLRKL